MVQGVWRRLVESSFDFWGGISWFGYQGLGFGFRFCGLQLRAGDFRFRSGLGILSRGVSNKEEDSVEGLGETV